MTTICMSTPFGDIYAQLALHEAPLTVANFLMYVRDHAYHDGRVWRTVVTNPDNQPINSIIQLINHIIGHKIDIRTPNFPNYVGGKGNIRCK